MIKNYSELRNYLNKKNINCTIYSHSLIGINVKIDNHNVVLPKSTLYIDYLIDILKLKKGSER